MGKEKFRLERIFTKEFIKKLRAQLTPKAYGDISKAKKITLRLEGVSLEERKKVVKLSNKHLKQEKAFSEEEEYTPGPPETQPKWRMGHLGAIQDFFNYDSVLYVPLKNRSPIVIFKHLKNNLIETTVNIKKDSLFACNIETSNSMIFWKNKLLRDMPDDMISEHGDKSGILEIPIKLYL